MILVNKCGASQAHLNPLDRSFVFKDAIENDWAYRLLKHSRKMIKQKSDNEICLINTRTADEIARKVLHQWESKKKARPKITKTQSKESKKEPKKVTLKGPKKPTAPKRVKKCVAKPNCKE